MMVRIRVVVVDLEVGALEVFLRELKDNLPMG